MNIACLMQLSPEAACRRLEAVDRERKAQLAEWLALIALIDERKDYRPAGYSSMCAYCMGRLGMTLDRALRLIQVARVAKRFPATFEYLADGRLGLTTLSELAPSLREENATELLAAAAFKTKADIRRLLTDQARMPCQAAAAPEAPEASAEHSLGERNPGHIGTLSDLGAPPSTDTPSGKYAPAHVGMTRRGRITPSPTGDYDVKLSITAEERTVLRRAEDLLGHAVPSGDPAEIYARAMKAYVAQLEKERFGVKRSASVANAVTKSRRPTKAMRGFVYERDGEQCTFTGLNGHRCEETRGLEVDHIEPWSEGGLTTPANLRLLCPSHNQFAAEQALGKQYVQDRREIAERERARDKAAREADKVRDDERAKAKRTRFDEVIPYLRRLRFSAEEARLGAELCEAMPDAPLGKRVLFASSKLTRCSAHGGTGAPMNPAGG